MIWRGYWCNVAHQRQRFEVIGAKLGVKDLNGWYSVTHRDINQNNGRGVMLRYDNSVYKALEWIYPWHNWQPERFRKVPQRYWGYKHNQGKLLDTISETLNVKELDGWYNISVASVIKQRGHGLISRFNGSLQSALCANFPCHAWSFKEKGDRNPYRYWQDSKNVKDFLHKAMDTLGIKTLSSWYTVSKAQVCQIGGGGLLRYYPQVLSVLDPQYRWEWHKFMTLSKKSRQRWMSSCISRVFPESHVIDEHAVGTRAASGRSLTVDVFVPDLTLAFEYQGEQHYDDKVFGEGLSSVTREAYDVEKRVQCHVAGITLVIIPYWWDGTTQSLIKYISNQAPHVQVSTQLDDALLFTDVNATCSFENTNRRTMNPEQVKLANVN